MFKANLCFLDNYIGSNNRKNTLHLNKELKKEPHVTQELSFSKSDFESLENNDMDSFIWKKHFGHGQYRVISVTDILDQELKNECGGSIKDENYDCFIVVVKLEIEKKDNKIKDLYRLLKNSTNKISEKDHYFISSCITNLKQGEEFLLRFLKTRGYKIENGFESFRDASIMIEDIIKHLENNYYLEHFPFDEYLSVR